MSTVIQVEKVEWDKAWDAALCKLELDSLLNKQLSVEDVHRIFRFEVCCLKADLERKP